MGLARTMVGVAASLILFSLACGEGESPGADEMIGANYLAHVDSPAAGEIALYGIQIVRSPDGGRANPVEVRFSATSGTVFPEVDTSDATTGAVHTNWTIGGQVGPQQILAEAFRLGTGERLGGFGQDVVVVPGKAAHLTLTTDSLVLFTGETRTITPFVASVSDSFGNSRPLGTHNLATTGGAWTIVGDTIRADSAQTSGLIISAGLTAETLFVRAEERYLFTRVFNVSFTCTKADSSRYDLVGITSPLLVYGDSTFKKGYTSLGYQLPVTATQTYYVGEVVVDVRDVSFQVPVQAWWPDSIAWSYGGAISWAKGTASRVGATNTFVGGDWCEGRSGAGGSASPVVLSR